MFWQRLIHIFFKYRYVKKVTDWPKNIKLKIWNILDATRPKMTAIKQRTRIWHLKLNKNKYWCFYTNICNMGKTYEKWLNVWIRWCKSKIGLLDYNLHYPTAPTSTFWHLSEDLMIVIFCSWSWYLCRCRSRCWWR